MSPRWSFAAVVRAANAFIWASAAALTVAMIMLIVLQIVGRYIFEEAPAWTEEAARFAMVWAGLLGGVVAFQTDADPVLTPVGRDKPFWLRRVQAWSRTLCVAIFTLVVLYYSPGFISRASARDSEALGWNMGLVGAIVPIYAALILLLAVIKLIVFERSRGEEGGGGSVSVDL
ncbi:MAG: TRAP transporter small permease subunit [Hyphomonadaceae bacterium]|nr:TRAP transporter small permease subunit [Hyphomonadaceae bacterium]